MIKIDVYIGEIPQRRPDCLRKALLYSVDDLLRKVFVVCIKTIEGDIIIIYKGFFKIY